MNLFNMAAANLAYANCTNSLKADEITDFSSCDVAKRLILNVNEHYQILNFNIRIIKKKQIFL